MVKLNKYSIGIGDRFAHQASAQLAAVQLAKTKGVDITPVWNKSHREHLIIGSEPGETRLKADLAVKELNWQDPYFLDADHINLSNVDHFMESSDFFTIDVADYIGKATNSQAVTAFVEKNKSLCGSLELSGTGTSLEITKSLLQTVAEKYLFATLKAKEIYEYIASRKEAGTYIIEVSMDETDQPQTPDELFLILAALAEQDIPLRTIAPKFSGRFNKGVEYVGDLDQFKIEFEQDIAVVKFAIEAFNLPKDLKLSIHSGSDKFSIYPIMHAAIKSFDIGLHIKTAGTTWLEELIGLAEAGGTGLDIAKTVYRKSLDKYEELCAPYAAVIDINPASLPSAKEVSSWKSQDYTGALRHDQNNPNYNLHFRQLLHVGYKVAADMGETYVSALRANQAIIAKNVTENIYERHIKPLFL